MGSVKEYYIIVKKSNEKWFLFNMNHFSFGKRVVWTPFFQSALVFPTEKSVENYKFQNLQNVQSTIFRISDIKLKTFVGF